jgi:hypothetical protein
MSFDADVLDLVCVEEDAEQRLTQEDALLRGLALDCESIDLGRDERAEFERRTDGGRAHTHSY